MVRVKAALHLGLTIPYPLIIIPFFNVIPFADIRRNA